MMSAMKIRHELSYDAPPAVVYAMLSDPTFRTQVCDAMQVADREVSIDRTASGMDVRIDMTQPTAGVPAFARRIVGDTTRVIQSETWQAEQGADLEVRIPGKPGHIRGRITLSADGTGTTERLFIEGMDTEQAVGTRWLAEREHS
jgi:uncharacterized protein YndB with AHSA1/START domain